MMLNYCSNFPLCYNWAMSELDTMFRYGIVPDLDRFYDTGEVVPVSRDLPVSNPITPETPGFEQFTQEEITQILEVEGS